MMKLTLGLFVFGFLVLAFCQAKPDPQSVHVKVAVKGDQRPNCMPGFFPCGLETCCRDGERCGWRPGSVGVCTRKEVKGDQKAAPCKDGELPCWFGDWFDCCISEKCVRRKGGNICIP